MPFLITFHFLKPIKILSLEGILDYSFARIRNSIEREVKIALAGEAAEALLNLATGVTPQIAQPVPVDTNPFEHPDAQRRFRVMTNVEELERAMNFPWEKWTVFLHPRHRIAACPICY